jgi:hypothetical protein
MMEAGASATADGATEGAGAGSDATAATWAAHNNDSMNIPRLEWLARAVPEREQATSSGDFSVCFRTVARRTQQGTGAINMLSISQANEWTNGVVKS